MRLLRDAAYLAAAAATAPVWAWSMHRTGKLRTDWNARFGHGDALPPAARGRILAHAVSVGEVNAIRTLVDRLGASDAASRSAPRGRDGSWSMRCRSER